MNLADQSTVGGELMAWALEECCRHARDWRAEDLTPTIGLNISPHQLLAPEFALGLGRRVAEFGLSAATFVIELTESAWTVDSAEALEVIQDLRSAGFPMALDDFGAGYSSLSRLPQLGFDVIKIDHRMLVDVPGDLTAVKLLKAAFDLALACGSDVVAEGVETEVQVEFLLAHGISHAQGLHLGAPMRLPEITALLRRRLVVGAPPAKGDAHRTGPLLAAC